MKKLIFSFQFLLKNTVATRWWGQLHQEGFSGNSDRKQMFMCAKSLQSCLTFWDPMGCSPPGSSVLGTLQARIPEWVAMPLSRRSS